MSQSKKHDKKRDFALSGALIKKLRLISILLILSVSCNILFLSFSIYSFLAKRDSFLSPSLYHFNLLAHLASTTQKTNQEVLNSLLFLPSSALLEKLESQEMVEDGYSERDLALACLVHYHYFDIQRALKPVSQALQKRSLFFDLASDPNAHVKLTVFPGLKDEDFQAILHFARTEQWPLTTEGLFAHLKAGGKPDKALEDAFYLTTDFITVETLIGRSHIFWERSRLMRMLLSGSWLDLHEWAATAVNSALSEQESRRSLLLTYIKCGSEDAAVLFLKTDMDFALKRLRDSACIQLLTALTPPAAEGTVYCQELLKSPRSDQVLQAAQHWLLESQQLAEALLKPPAPAMPPVPVTPPRAKSKEIKSELKSPLFQGKARSESFPCETLSQSAARFKRPSFYTVKEGDTLWAIARRLGADVEDLKRLNQLDSDFLRPGLQLLLP
ncbi:MAG: hypothetical protein K0S07_60 [Chlamydiales bacterium]|jgi:hypothetical protein|nr:hypothetical protein [Chlamydiales bacterium]